MKIKRVVVRNFRGIEELDLAVGASGAIAKGRNGSGKSSFLKAVKAALTGQDVSSDAIRQGADEALVLIDTDDVSVRKVLYRDGKPDLVVERGEIPQKKPATLLTSLLGSSTLDPMDLLLLKGKERRAAILGALDVRVTVDQLRKWWPKCPDSYDCSGHGLEVVAGVRDSAYKKRTDLNRTAKSLLSEADRLAQEASAAASAAPTEAPAVAPLEEAWERAKAYRAGLQSRANEAAKSEKRTASARAKVAELKSRSAEIRAGLTEVAPEALAAATEQAKACEADVLRIQKELELANIRFDAAQEALQSVRSRVATYERALSTADSIAAQATDLEGTIAAAAVEAVSEQEANAALDAESRALGAVMDARRAEEAHRRAIATADAATKARKAADEAAADSARLDEVVRALTEDAPTELMAAADGIPGLSLDGDNVLLDGVGLDGLCGAEQIRLCVEVARRANAKSRILVVDGLERLDPEAFEVFVRESTRDGFQLLGTRVDRGELVIESLEPEPEQAPEAIPATEPAPASAPEVAA